MTTFTREDFEMAAKAAGLQIAFSPIAETPYLPNEPDRVSWIPPHDDGDALRLAVRLGLQITIGKIGVLAIKLGYEEIFEPTGADRNAATRAAIFRAAIAMGRAMP